jgi:hypothetical protein
VDTTYPFQEGRKFDKGKPRYGLLKPEALEEVVKVLTYGAEKYSPDNWKHVENMHERYFDASQRHTWAHWRGELRDEETGYYHLAHAICNLMFLLQSELDADVPF